MVSPTCHPHIGIIGLGAMGVGMARNLSHAEVLSTVWNRTSEKAALLAAELNCTHSLSLEEISANCSVIVICVSRDEDVLAIIDALVDSIQAGSLVLDCSTVSADTAKQAAAKLAQVNCGFLDCPVSGGTEGAAKGTLAIMVGGNAALLPQAMPALEAMGSNIVHMGPVGAGQATKAVNQIVCAGINQAVTEAMAFAEAMDLPVDKVVDVVSSGASGNWFLQHRGKTMVRDQFPPGFKVALHQKDLQICQQMAAEKGVALDSIELCLRDYPELIENGHAEHDISSLFSLKRAKFLQG